MKKAAQGSYGTSPSKIQSKFCPIDLVMVNDQPLTIEAEQQVNNLNIGMPEDDSPILMKKDKGLPEILETLNDHDDDSDNYFKEMSEEEFSKFRLSFKKPGYVSSKGLYPGKLDEDAHLDQDLIKLNFKKAIKNPEEQFASSPALLLSQQKAGTLKQTIQTPDDFHQYVQNLNTIVQSSPRDLREDQDTLMKFYSNVASPASMPLASKNLFDPRPDTMNSVASPDNLVPSTRVSNMRNQNASDMSSDSFLDFEKEEGQEESDMSFKSALPLIEDPSELDIADQNLAGGEHKGLVKLKHDNLLLHGWKKQKNVFQIAYEKEKPRGFNPNFPNGRVLFANKLLQIKIEHATLNSFGNAFFSEHSEKKDAVIAFDLLIESLGHLDVEVFTLRPEDSSDIKLELDDSPVVIK
jgi:hypothetical protein